MKLDLFQKIDSIADESISDKFKLLRDEFTLEGERNVLLNWTDGFEDRDNKIIKEFQTTLHSAFWEFYLFSLFKEAGCSIDFTKNRPDFIIKSPYKVNIEAVVSQIKNNGRKEKDRNIDDILSMLEPPELIVDFPVFLNEGVTRYSNSIHSKYKKFQNEYSNCDWIDVNDPFVIAIASYDQVNYGREFYYPMLALLYGLYYDASSKSYKKVEHITKPDTDAQIPVGLFQNSEMENLSAIIFSCTMTMGKLTSLSKSQQKFNIDTNHVFTIRHDFDPPHYKIQEFSANSPEELSEGVFIFHNPFAKNKLPVEMFANTSATQVTIENGELKCEGESLPIVSRFNCSKILLPEKMKAQIIAETFKKFNPEIEMSLFEVLSIDFESSPKEIVLMDKFLSLPVAVDLSDKDAILIQANSISEGDEVNAVIRKENKVATIWKLVSISKYIS